MRLLAAYREAGPFQRDGCVLLAYAALVVALTWPLSVRLGDVVPRDLGDPLLSTWTLWWNARVTPFTDAWWNGPIFFPARDTLALSDHRVGLALIATPLIWSGASPLLAYNGAFLFSFFLSAVSAYALCLSLTKHRGAAFVGGLVYGFHPFRAAHLAHLELLSSYWLPVVLLALHRWAVTQSTRWLVLLSSALTLQGLTSGYYLFFSGVLLCGWLVWFASRGVPVSQYARLALALAAPLVVLAPVLARYRDTHRALGISRSITEVERFSADLIGLLTAPESLAFWRAPGAWQSPEGALFPGVTAVILVVLAWRHHVAPLPPDRWRRARLVSAAIALAAAAVAMVPVVSGPVAFDVAGLSISVSRAYKPLSVAALFASVCLLSAPRVRGAWKRASPLTFYALATPALWIFALGPTARFLGHRVLYKSPYSWLMTLPGFSDEFRAPARFGMLAALTLSVAAALALARLLVGRSRRAQAAAVCLVTAGVCVDGWIAPFPLATPPKALVLAPRLPADSVVLELPLGVFEDAAAMYRAMSHGHRIANGLSGYFPPHYDVLSAALEEGRVEALTPLAAEQDVALFVSRTGVGAALGATLLARTPATPLARTERHDVYWLPRSPVSRAPTVDGQSPLPMRSVTSAINPRSLALLDDGDRHTMWVTPGPQRGDEQLVVDLGGVAETSGVVLGLGYPRAFPRTLAVDVSSDGVAFTEIWRGDTASRTVAAAIDNPAEVRVPFPFPPRAARYVRVRQLGHSASPWAIAELSIVGAPSASTPTANDTTRQLLSAF